MSSSAMRRSSVSMRRPRRASRGRIVSVMLSCTDSVGMTPSALRSSGMRAMPAAMAARVEPPRTALPFDRDLAGVELLLAEDRLGRRGASGAEQAGQADHLAPMDRHIHVVDDVAPGQPLSLEHDVRAIAAARRLNLVTRVGSTISRPSISAMSASRSMRGERPVVDPTAVPEDGDRVAETEDLVESMGDVDDAPRPRHAAAR